MSTHAVSSLLRDLAELADARDRREAGELREASTLLSSSAADYRSSIAHLPLAARALDDIESLGVDAVRANAWQRLPRVHRALLGQRAVTVPEVRTILCDHGIATFADLSTAADDGRLHALPGTLPTRVVDGMAALRDEFRPIPLGRAWDLSEAVSAAISAANPLVTAIPAGDLRRFEPTVAALVIAVNAPDPEAAIENLRAVALIEDILYRTPRRAIVRVQQTEVDIRAAARDEFGSMLFSVTGPPRHVASVLRRQRRPMLHGEEADVYAMSDLPWIPPELRHVDESGAHGIQPAALITTADIRGDLHMHTSASDGQDPLEAMVATAAALGYEYIAITDHSEHAGASRTVSLEQLARQADDIARLRESYPSMAILHGIEVDILRDGRLDCPDDVLEKLDIVVASLHDWAGHDGRELTRRSLQAIAHPFVNILAHPGHRIVGRRDRYPLDYDAVFAAAVESGTALEVDGAPSHLDLDGEGAEAAVRAGVTLTIDSDSHRAAVLERQMGFGVGTARRGKVEPRHVLNTRPLEAIRAFIAAKRNRR